jgi:CheY-like chemotaxis protein/HPt (histidine-containing phosphotransfer) domain-containing protein
MVPRDSQSGKEALGWLKAGECFDLAVLDLEMLEMDGVTLAEEIRKLPASQRMPVVLLTSLGVRPDQPELAKAGLAGCLAKPVKLAPFQEALRRALPGAQPPAAPEPVAAARAEGTSASPSTLRILVCDDNLVNQKVGLRLLQQIGHRATLAANGLEALAALERQPYDLIFMDVMMPEMDGLEATRLIRERQQQPALYPNYKSPLIIVAMTASAMHGDRDKCLAVGMDDYVAKPVRLEDLRQIVERWAEVAASTEPAVSGQDPFTTSGDTDSLVEANAASADAPVDMSRLLDFTDGNPENLRELAELYLSQTEEQLGQMKAAFHAGTAPEVRRLAHSCAGASATCGMRHLVPLLRELERLGSEGQLTGVGELCHQAGEEFDKIRSFLEAYLGEHASPAGKT